MDKQNIEEVIERRAVGTPKYSKIAIVEAFAFHPDMIFRTPSKNPEVLELRKYVSEIIPMLPGVRQFYSDAVSVAMHEYRHMHKKMTGNWLYVTLKVSTRSGDERIYTEKLRSIDVWLTEGIEEFGEHFASPTSLLLINQVAQEVEIGDVMQVTAYVYEVNEVCYV